MPANNQSAPRVAVELHLDGVSKTFGTNTALYPLTMTVGAGELVALLGPSGCGKTTTLRIIAGFEASDTGRVLLGGKDVTDLPPNKRNLGMVFQNYCLFPHMTVAQNVAFGLKMTGVGKAEIEERVRGALDLIRLRSYEDRFPNQLSGGQQQRVALARSLVTRPAVLLLDEPLGALDKNLRESMQFELRQLQRQLGITAVLVTHDQEEALTMSDLVAVMKDGRVLQYGAPSEVYDRPVNRFVSEFLGTSNLFRGTVSGRTADNLIDIRVPAAANLSLRAGTGFKAAAGQNVLAAIRPEKIQIGPLGQQSANSVAATITNHVFRGIYDAYQLNIDGISEPLFAYLQSRNDEAKPYDVGARVMLSWSTHDVVLLPEEAALPEASLQHTGRIQ